MPSEKSLELRLAKTSFLYTTLVRQDVACTRTTYTGTTTASKVPKNTATVEPVDEIQYTVISSFRTTKPFKTVSARATYTVRRVPDVRKGKASVERPRAAATYSVSVTLNPDPNNIRRTVNSVNNTDLLGKTECIHQYNSVQIFVNVITCIRKQLSNGHRSRGDFI